MPLDKGTRLGPYEIGALLGGGRQGDIYAARDTRLERAVAVKVLSERYSHSSEDLERFRREAMTLSALNHPHICALYDIGHEGDIAFLVMERVEGETVAQRLARGSLRITEALRIGAQIADALDRAHRVGVVHRDLKPGNVMLTKSGAKLMDFGLASAVRIARVGDSPPTAGLPHLTDSVTARGTVVGTPPYMAPEQLEGKPMDGRVDIWALGCLLFEMVTGRRAFEGESDPALISAIMRGEPQGMSELEASTPPALEWTVERCLAKDPDERWQSAADLRQELLWIAESGSKPGIPAANTQRRKSRVRVAWVLVAVLATIASAFVVVAHWPRTTPHPVVFEIHPPSNTRQTGFGYDGPRISPDGRKIAFNVEDSLGVRSIWLRDMTSPVAKQVPGTEGTRRLFWSPDSRFIGFFSGTRLYRIDLDGGPPIAICAAPIGDLASWGSRNVIVFDFQTGDSLQVVPASGGVPRTIPVVDLAKGESVGWPQFLPDGRHFLFVVSTPSNPEKGSLRVGSIDSKGAKTLGEVGSGAVFASGYVLYVHDGQLLARGFDSKAQRFRGEPFPVAENVAPVERAFLLSQFSVSTEGTLVYRWGFRGSNTKQRLVWLDREGREIATVGGPGRYRAPRLSPDDTRLAVVVGDARDSTRSVWIWDLSRDVGARLTSSRERAYSPIWSLDGSRLAYGIERGESVDIHVASIAAGEPDSVILHSDVRNMPEDWFPSGDRILYMRALHGQTMTADIYSLSLGTEPRSAPFVATESAEGQGRISPDGRWIAYTSLESLSGAGEVYVRALSGTGRAWKVSRSYGSEPQWRGDSRELYYLSADRQMMAVKIEGDTTPRLSAPHKLFDAPVILAPLDSRNRYDVSRDGNRFLVVAAARDSLGPTMVVLDWLGLVRGRSFESIGE